MDYKEMEQEVYEELLETLGRDPSTQELREALEDRFSDIIECYG